MELLAAAQARNPDRVKYVDEARELFTKILKELANLGVDTPFIKPLTKLLVYTVKDIDKEIASRAKFVS